MHHAVSSISPVTSSRRSAAIYRLSQTVAATSAKPVTSSASMQQPKAVSTPQNTQPAAQQSSLPLGVLMSATPPSASNTQATLDYLDLRNALQSGNLTVAQQAYQRLQSDTEISQ